MRRIQPIITFFFCLLSHVSVFSQELISGQVVNAASNQPLSDVSVFYNGTTLGTTTDDNGYFEIVLPKGLSAPLIISFIGFESLEINKVAPKDLGILQLKPKTVVLEGVILDEDIWSLEKKAAIFKKEFLGTSRAAQKSRILNLQDVIFKFSQSEKTLYAFSDVPISIDNPYLGYSVSCILEYFEINFDNIERRNPTISSTMFSCRTLYKEYEGGEFEKKRKKAYQGSVLHFMRSLSKKELAKEKFKIYRGGFQIDSYSQLKVKPLKHFVEVSAFERDFYIRFNDGKVSFMKCKTPIFFIDEYGNDSPNRSVFFGGHMGTHRMADFLPSSYWPND
ncbi:MAG: carboxypeptidase-like regulatory domain-containing protein [Bacteroidota bacterium]